MRTERQPVPLEDVTANDAMIQYVTLLHYAERKQSGHAAKRVLPETPDERAEELRTMPYSDFMASPEWLETSNRVKWLANRHCESCGTEHRLNTHHLTYERRGAEFFSDLIVFCHRCHMEFHRVMPS